MSSTFLPKSNCSINKVHEINKIHERPPKKSFSNFEYLSSASPCSEPKTFFRFSMIANLLILIDFREKLSSFFARERRLDVGWDEGEWLRSFSIFLSVWQMSFSRNINDFREKTTKKREESLLLPSYRITNIDVMKARVMSWAEENQAKQCLCFKWITDYGHPMKA